MDEPLSNLDAKLRVHMRTELAELHARLGATFIYVTHDQVEAMTMSDRVAMMDQRRDPAARHAERALRAARLNVKVAQFIGSPAINLLPGTRRRRRPGRAVRPAGCRSTSRSAPGSALTSACAPKRCAHRTAARRRAGCSQRLRRRENLGAELILHFDLAGADRAIRARAASAGDSCTCRPTARSTLAFDAAACHVFDADGRAHRRREPRRGAAGARAAPSPRCRPDERRRGTVRNARRRRRRARAPALDRALDRGSASRCRPSCCCC